VFDSAQTLTRTGRILNPSDLRIDSPKQSTCGSGSRLRNSPIIGTWRFIMLETIAVILIVFWLLGLVTSTTMGGLIHVLLVVAIVMVLVRVIQGRRL
jgi:hypothetical protein